MMFLKAVQDLYQRATLWYRDTSEGPILAWIGHEGSPKEQCALVGAATQDQALMLMKRCEKFDPNFVEVCRIPEADKLFDNQKQPILDLESNDKALYYYLIS